MRPHRWPPTRLLCPWDSPGKNTGVGCHFLFQCMKVKSESEVAQSCPTLSDLMDCSLPGSSVHGIFPGNSTGVGCHCLLWGLSVQFSGSVVTLCNPMNCSTPSLPVHHQHLEFTQIHVNRVGDAFQPSHPLLSSSPPAPNPSQHPGLFQ